MQIMTENPKEKLSSCVRCGKTFPKSALLDSEDGKLCVDCIVQEEMDTLSAEIDNKKNFPFI